jgi:hypothetical protein
MPKLLEMASLNMGSMMRDFRQVRRDSMVEHAP